MAIQTDDMTAFLAVAREGSFGRAATSLLVSQPAVSERMARLEREVGATLFDRGARGTTLTPAGEQLLPYAHRVTQLLDEAGAEVRRVDDAPRLRVAVHVTFAHRVVPLVLGALKDIRRSVKLRDAHSDEIISMLLDGVVDLGFVVPAARPPSLRFTPLPLDPVIAVSVPHRLTKTRILTLDELARSETRLAFNRWGSGATAFLESLHAANIPEWRWTECSDALTALDLARGGTHIALVPSSVAAEPLARKEVVQVDLQPLPKWDMPLVMAHRIADEGDAAIRAARASVRALSPPSL